MWPVDSHTGNDKESKREATYPVIVVAVDDRATASAVATAAGHVALDQGAETVILVHVCDAHTMVNAVCSVALGAVPIVESTEESAQVRALAEAASPQTAGVPLSPAQDGHRAAPPPPGHDERKGVVRSKTAGVRPHSAGHGGRSRPATPAGGGRARRADHAPGQPGPPAAGR